MSVYPWPNFFNYYLSIIYLNAGFTISPCLSFSTYYFCMFNKVIFSRLAISYIAMVKVFFSIFQFSVYFIKFEISNPILGFCQSFPRFCDSDLHI